MVATLADPTAHALFNTLHVTHASNRTATSATASRLSTASIGWGTPSRIRAHTPRAANPLRHTY